MPTLGQALSQLHEHLFVGRQTELGVFERWLQETTDPPSILNVSGIGGSGKTELLQAFRRRLTQLGIAAHYVDGRAVRSSEAELAAALEPVRHRETSVVGQPSAVLLVDTYEEIGAHDRWFREAFLAQLDSAVRVVLAGRFPVDHLWSASGGWSQLVQPLPIGPLSKAATGEYLSQRGISDEAFLDQIWDFTRGHPLALCLATDLAQRLGPREFTATPQRYLLLRTLSRRLLDGVGNREFRELLESAAMVRQFDEAMLAALIGYDGLGDSFEQLCRLSIVRPVAHGLAVHDVVRRALTDELRWRNPARYATLRSRALGFYSTRFQSASPADRHWLVADWLSFSTRALIQHLMFEEGEPGEIIVEPARVEDDGAIRILRSGAGARREALGHGPLGDLTADDLDFPTAPARHMVARNWDGEVVGYSTVIPLCQATVALLRKAGSPTRIALSGLDEEALEEPTASLEAADTFLIWHVVSGPDAAPSVQSALIRDLIGLIAQGKRYLILTAVPEHQALLAALGFQPMQGVADHPYRDESSPRGFVLDLRACGSERWVQAVLNGELPIELSREPAENLPSVVREVLAHWADDATLASSPLLRYGNAQPTMLPRERAKAVRAVICKAIDQAAETAPSADRDVLRAVELAYLERSISHERLAERLSVSRSTLYRMLRRGNYLLAARIDEAV